MRYITNVYIKIKPLRMRYFLQLVHLYGKKAGNYNNKKERRKYPAIHINVPQSAHIILHFIKSVISKCA